MPDVLVQLVPDVEAVSLPVDVTLARLSRQIGNAISEDAMPLFRQVEMHLESKILTPRFRVCCDVKTMLPGKFAQAIVEVPDVAKADADVSKRCRHAGVVTNIGQMGGRWPLSTHSAQPGPCQLQSLAPCVRMPAQVLGALSQQRFGRFEFPLANQIADQVPGVA